MNTARSIFACLALCAGAAAAADTISLESAGSRALLLELYTSQGCSSCPPADGWLSGLVDDPRLWRELVPVAFHVDYWDYLGWQDPNARPSYSARQAAYRAAGHLPTVYTPAFLLGGREWRGWLLRRTPETPSVPAGVLRAQADAAHARVHYVQIPAERGELVAHFVRLGFGLDTAVRGGENGGKRLREDFVVLAHRREPMVATAQGHVAELALLPPSTAPAGGRWAVAAWVTRAADPAPLQAVGGWLADR